MESASGKHMIKCVILDNDSNDQCIIGTDFLAHPHIHTILNFKDNSLEIQDINWLLKVIATIRHLTKTFLNIACNNLLEGIPEEERVSFCDNKSDTFSQIEEIEAEKLIQQLPSSSHQLPVRRMEVMELDELIFLVAQASITPNFQQWVTGIVFPLTSALIPHLIIQPLTNNQVAMEFSVETTISNITNGTCPVLLINNMPNSIQLRPNQLVTMAQHTLEAVVVTSPSTDISITFAASDGDLTDHKPAALDKSQSGHTDKQKLDFALNKKTEKTCVTTAQKA
uniref:Uncharacterized protein n=1 Tax=Romanomermis culicivorax TaxID=13658 RepID=A0A915HL71_ROMCU